MSAPTANIDRNSDEPFFLTKKAPQRRAFFVGRNPLGQAYADRLPYFQANCLAGIELNDSVCLGSGQVRLLRISRNRAFDMDDPVASEPDNIQREAHLFHPETVFSGRFKEEKHPAVRAEGVTLSEAERPFLCRLAYLQAEYPAIG